MTRGTPCRGFPSRKAACNALREQGRPTREIAALTGLTLAQTNWALYANSKGDRTVSLPKDAYVALMAEAKARKRTTPDLIRSLLEAIVDDDMVAAVLDE